MYLMKWPVSVGSCWFEADLDLHLKAAWTTDRNSYEQQVAVEVCAKLTFTHRRSSLEGGRNLRVILSVHFFFFCAHFVTVCL